MSVRNLLIATSFASLTAMGCVGEFEDPGEGPENPGTDPGFENPLPPSGEGEADADTVALFEETVQPVLNAKCSGAACHSGAGTFPPKFLGDGQNNVYQTLVSFDSVIGGFQPGIASIITRVDPGPHTPVLAPAQEYTPGDVAAISDWLDAEYQVRGLGDGDVPPDENAPLTSRQAMMEFVGCMTLANWEQADMGDFADKNSGDGPCRNCHNDGLARFNTNDESELMFQYNRYEIFSVGFFATRVDPVTGNAEVIPAHDKLEIMSDGGGAGGIHPTFRYDDDDDDYQALQEFYDLTMAAKAQGVCGPAAFATPPQPELP